MAATVPVDLYRLSLERYEQMIDAGILGPHDRVELLRGVLSEMTPQGTRHAALVERLTIAFARGLDYDAWSPRVQLPLRLASTQSIPEPDVAIVPAGDYSDAHPESAALVVEVSDSSIGADLTNKLGIYAEAGIAELWIVDVPAGVVRRHREPRDGTYARIDELATGELTPDAPGIPTVDAAALLRRG